MPHVLASAPGKRREHGTQTEAPFASTQREMTPFARLLHRYCFEHEVSLYELAPRIGVDNKTVWKWYRHGTQPRRETLLKLHTALGIPADQLLEATAAIPTPARELPLPAAPPGPRKNARASVPTLADAAPVDDYDAFVLRLATIRDPQARAAVMAVVRGQQQQQAEQESDAGHLAP
jgi:transcriptional regulator with XRE-family HTH domain